MPANTKLSKEEREQAIALAIRDVQVDHISIRKAAEQRGIPRQTLENRLQGRQERHLAHEHEQVLSPLEELEVVEFCRRMERRFLPVRTTHVVSCAQKILNNRLGTTDRQLGKHWIERFLDRHPELKLTTSKRIDERRVMAKNPAYVIEFYVLLAKVFKKYKITPDRVFNMDEKGYQIGITGKETVIVFKHDYRDGYAGGSKDSGNRETVTTIDCICADGTVLPPMIIMKGKYVLHQWIANSPLPKETRWAASPSGWTDNELGLEWIKAFDQWTTKKSADAAWRCLILDGHVSHVSFDFLDYALKTQIIVVGLPSHTTDFLQPLDRVIFRVLQRSYGQAVQERTRKMLAATKKNFSQLLHEARENAYTEEHILSAFEATGISPFDPYRSTVMQDFLEEIRRRHQPALKLPEGALDPEPSLLRRQDHKQIIENLYKLAVDPSASSEELRAGLTNALKLYEGSEARGVILEDEVLQMHEADRQKQIKKPRAGWVGRARVYEQEAVEAIRLAEEERAQSLANRGRASGKGRGRRQVRGRGRGRGNAPIMSVAETSSGESDMKQENEDM